MHSGQPTCSMRGRESGNVCRIARKCPYFPSMRSDMVSFSTTPFKELGCVGALAIVSKISPTSWLLSISCRVLDSVFSLECQNPKGTL
ncbi:hypothetical protein CDAR_613611 [Caerostris darwini]|uniref:Uncharacterized protein n=1 Tax=Caerostris darwini TaxID=1538125 RepID=A0AAV4RWV4_9ARAC|nr:hypothetical protein CDAR_613611 [Caerostris darwini]